MATNLHKLKLGAEKLEALQSAITAIDATTLAVQVIAGINQVDIEAVASVKEEIEVIGSDPLKTAILGAESNANATIDNLALTNADVLLTHEDVRLAGLDVDATNADVLLTNEDVRLTGLDVVATEGFRDEAEQFAIDAEASADRAELFDPATYKFPDFALVGDATANELSSYQITITPYDATADYTTNLTAIGFNSKK